MKQLLLFTKNSDTARKLQELGFQVVSSTVDGWTFLNSTNNSYMALSEFDKNNISVTDKLCI